MRTDGGLPTSLVVVLVLGRCLGGMNMIRLGVEDEGSYEMAEEEVEADI
jgi:hypothetical protein